MKKLLFLAMVALSQHLFAQAGDKPAAKIDVSQFPSQAKMIEEVVVPVPSEIFGVLDHLGRPNWHDVLRPTKGDVRPGGREQNALLLGTVIAEGFIAVEDQNSEEVKKIGKHVLNLAGAIGVRKAVLMRSESIIEAADKKNWTEVRRELDGALRDVKNAMAELNSLELSQLVSLGGWLRGTEALTMVVEKTFTKEGAELLHQPVLLDYFNRRIANMDKARKENPLVIKVQQGLVEIRPLMGLTSDPEISEKSVKEIRAITERILKAINAKTN